MKIRELVLSLRLKGVADAPVYGGRLFIYTGSLFVYDCEVISKWIDKIKAF